MLTQPDKVFDYISRFTHKMKKKNSKYPTGNNSFTLLDWLVVGCKTTENSERQGR